MRLPALPFAADLPPEGSRLRPVAQCARVAAWAGLLAALAAACVQFQARTAEVQDEARPVDRAYIEALAAYRREPSAENRQRAGAAARAVVEQDHSRGAIARWAFAVRALWAGRNIYAAPPEADLLDALTGQTVSGAAVPSRPERVLADTPEGLLHAEVWLHPNMPFLVLLLTPLAYLPAQAMAAVVNLLKAAGVLASIWMLAEVAAHQRHRMGDWVMGLAVLMVLPLLLADIQHGNTNIFVLLAVAAHLWLYRRGHDRASGAALALAVCLKLTPVLFVLYWLHQRNWRLLRWVAVHLAVMAVVVPLIVFGWQRYDVLTGAWLENLVTPGLLEGAPYPIHVNQSLWGVFTRLFMHGNIYYNPDDGAPRAFDYINLAGLSLPAGRLLVGGLKLALVGAAAAAIGWRVLPRNDARRGLHYGLLAAGMLILNQRTWDHHATVLLLTTPAVWYALAYGNLRGGLRRVTLAATALSAVPVLVMREGLFVLLAGKQAGKHLNDVVAAWGPMLGSLLILFALCATMLLALRQHRAPEAEPYASIRQAL